MILDELTYMLTYGYLDKEMVLQQSSLDLRATRGGNGKKRVGRID